VKELRDELHELQKNLTGVILFKSLPQQYNTHTEGFSPKKNQNDLIENEEPVKEQCESDLNLLIPESFNEIPYI